jgi:hypothetical protein
MDEKDKLRAELNEALSRCYCPVIARFALACLGGIPFAGGAFGAASGAWAEAEQNHYNKVFASWVKLQEDELREIAITIAEILSRLDINDPKISARIESPEYLRLIKKCFRDWSAAESEEKRVLVRNLLTNAAVHRICADDVVNMFIQWIDTYSESHFAVIRYIYMNEGRTRREIWAGVHGNAVRDDSAEADLFRLLIGDVSAGLIIRQHREKDYHGHFLKAPRKARGEAFPTMTSPFDDEKRYDLTEIGKQFVRYTMEGVMPLVGAPPPQPDTPVQ